MTHQQLMCQINYYTNKSINRPSLNQVWNSVEQQIINSTVRFVIINYDGFRDDYLHRALHLLTCDETVFRNWEPRLQENGPKSAIPDRCSYNEIGHRLFAKLWLASYTRKLILQNQVRSSAMLQKCSLVPD